MSRNKTISLPDEIADRLADHTDVNWSHVAAEAFQQHLVILDRKDIPMTTIERLRASKKETHHPHYDCGHVAGRRWAADNAEFVELKSLSVFSSELHGHERERIFTTVESDSPDVDDHIVDEYIYRKIFGDTDFDHRDSKCFWGDWVFRDGLDSADDWFVEGFVDGAVELFREVEKQL